ncbi:MAG TPA: hypothetical protein VJR91_10925 [Burkholderia sp.]|nr:hypothetical protein [Burkholderia sp.]
MYVMRDVMRDVMPMRTIGVRVDHSIAESQMKNAGPKAGVFASGERSAMRVTSSAPNR